MISLNNYMPWANNRKRQKVFRSLGFALTNFWTTMYYKRTKLGKIWTLKTFCRMQSKNFHAKVSLENTATWKKSSTSSLDLCVRTKVAQITVLEARWSRNPVWSMEYTRMVQLWKMWKDINQLRMPVLSRNSGSYGISFKI